jgi:hypothetical protein
MRDRHEQALVRLEALARLMDSAFVLPGTDIRFGIDSIAGLVPGIGDAISGIVSSYLIWEAKRLGVSKWTLARMAANTLIDTSIGSIPVLGDVFDATFRSNVRNMAILRKHLESEGLVGRGGPVIEADYVRVG